MEKDTPTPTALPTRLTARETSSDSDITLIGRNSSLFPETQRPSLEDQQADPEKKLEPPIDFEKRDLGRGNRDTDDHDIQKPPTLHPYDFDTQHTPRDFEKIDFISTPENAVTQPQTPHIHDPNRLTPYTTVSPSKYHTPRPSHLNPTTPQRPWLARQRPELTSNPTASASTRTLPQLKRKETRMMQKEAHPWEHLGITLGLPAIVLFDIVIPIIIYYSWYNAQPRVCDPTCHRRQFDKDIMGYAVICFGFGELWILLARVWRLYFRHDECAPLLSRSKWELDATCWVYLVAMVMALIPFVVGSSLVIPELYLYGPSFLMGFLGLLMVGTLVPFKLPIGINSQPRGTTIRPFIYYAAEDFIAVDGLQDREFRERYNQRYERNKAFRRMFLWLTLWWLAGVMTFIGCVSAVIWNCQFHIAFGLSLGVLFSYIAIWAGCSAAYVKWEIRRQHRLFEKGLVDA